MLGIADCGLVFDLFETVMKGDAAGALRLFDSLHQGGADPLMVLQDLAELIHFVTRLKVVPDAGVGDPAAEGDRARAQPLTIKLTMPVLARAWQMLLKGIEEAQEAYSPAQAAEMVLVRLAYVAELPAPAELVRSLSGGPPVAATNAPSPSSGERVGVGVRGQASEVGSEMPSPGSSLAGRATLSRNAGEGINPVSSAAGNAAVSLVAAEPAATPDAAPVAALEPMPQSFTEVIELFDGRREALLRSHLWSHVHLVAFEPGRIEFRPQEAAPRDLANRLGQMLGEWTGQRWVVAVSQAEGAPTLAEEAARRDGELRSEVAAHPMVRAALETFPGAVIAAVRERYAVSEPAAAEPAPEDEPAMDDAGGETVSEEDEA
jgi:DNA polymerase-3 subunit gamma/tau